MSDFKTKLGDPVAMPYDSVADLPEQTKKLSPAQKRAFKSAFNSAMADGKGEKSAFKIAWSAANGVSKADVRVKAHRKSDGTEVKEHTRRGRVADALDSLFTVAAGPMKEAAVTLGVGLGAVALLRFGAPLIAPQQRAFTWQAAARKGAESKSMLTPFTGTVKFGKSNVFHSFKVLDPKSYSHLQGTNYASTLRNVESAIKGLPAEHAFVISRKGQIVSGFQGTRGQVGIAVPMAMPARLRRNFTITHNHPINTPYSGADLAFQNLSGVGEMRAVLPNGSISAMRMKRGMNPLANARSKQAVQTQVTNEAQWLQKNIVSKMSPGDQTKAAMGDFGVLERGLLSGNTLTKYTSQMDKWYANLPGWERIFMEGVVKFVKRLFEDTPEPDEPGSKPNIGAWLESRLHWELTRLADDLYGDGKITREHRIVLSSAIGDALGRYTKTIERKAPEIYELKKLGPRWTGPGGRDALVVANPKWVAKHLAGRHNQADHARSEHRATATDTKVLTRSDLLKAMNAKDAGDLEVRDFKGIWVVRNKKTGAVARVQNWLGEWRVRPMGRITWPLSNLGGSDVRTSTLLADIESDSKVVGKHLIGRHNQQDHDPTKKGEGGHTREQHSKMPRPLFEQAALGSVLGSLSAYMAVKPSKPGPEGKKIGSGPAARAMYGLYALNFLLGVLSNVDRGRAVQAEQRGEKITAPEENVRKAEDEPLDELGDFLESLSEQSGVRPGQLLEDFGGWLMRKKIVEPTEEDLHEFLIESYGDGVVDD